MLANTEALKLNGTLTIGNMSLGEITDYSITYVTGNPMPPTVAFVVQFPPELTITSNLTCSLIIPGANAKIAPTIIPMPCVGDATAAANTVTMNAGEISDTIPAGTKITLKMTDIQNADTQDTLASLTLMSFKDETWEYSIDSIVKGLVSQSTCDYPCATCSSKSRSTCTSCITTKDNIPEKYLALGKCVESCPDGFYTNDFKCLKCPADCKTCSDANTCTSCDTSARGKLKYMSSISRCMSACPMSTFSDDSFTCQPCNSNCAGCSGNATNCTSCPSAFPFLSLSKTCVL